MLINAIKLMTIITNIANRQLEMLAISSPRGTPITVPTLIPPTVKAIAFPLCFSETK